MRTPRFMVFPFMILLVTVSFAARSKAEPPGAIATDIHGLCPAGNYKKTTACAVDGNGAEYKGPRNTIGRTSHSYKPAGADVAAPNNDISQSYPRTNPRSEPLLPAGKEMLAQLVPNQKAAEPVKPAETQEEPKPELERPTVWGEPTEVKILIYVIDVDEVNSAQQSFTASVYYEARWVNPLLRHKGPGPMHRSLNEVWNPRLVIVGQQMAWKAFPEYVEIEPDGQVVYRQKVWGRFSQPLELHEFPMDRQILTIHIAAAGLLEEHVKMIPLGGKQGGASAIASRFSLPDFAILSWKVEPAPYFPAKRNVGIAGFQMQIEIQRLVTYFALKVIVPLCLIVIMSWLPCWIDPKQIGTNIGIATTSFLTLVAYLFAITVLLPPVSYVTRLDRFIFLSTLMVFAGLLQTVTNTALVNSNRVAVAERIDRWLRVVYPIILVIILAVSFAR